MDPMANKYPGLSPYAFTFNNPIIFKDVGGADGSLTVVKNKDGGGVITLETTIHVYGKDAKTMMKDLIKKSAALSTPKYFKDETGGVWQVDIKIKYIQGYALEVAEKNHKIPVGTALQASELSWMEQIATGVQPGDNILKIDHDIKLPGAFGHSAVGASGGIVGKDGGIKTGIHEPGHMIGFGDRYIDYKGTGLPYDDPVFKGDPMVSGEGEIIEWNLIHFYDVFKEGMNALEKNGGVDVLKKVISKSLDTPVPTNADGVGDTKPLYDEAKSKEVPAPKKEKKVENTTTKPK